MQGASRIPSYGRHQNGRVDRFQIQDEFIKKQWREYTSLSFYVKIKFDSFPAKNREHQESI